MEKRDNLANLTLGFVILRLFIFGVNYWVQTNVVYNFNRLAWRRLGYWQWFVFGIYLKICLILVNAVDEFVFRSNRFLKEIIYICFNFKDMHLDHEETKHIWFLIFISFREVSVTLYKGELTINDIFVGNFDNMEL